MSNSKDEKYLPGGPKSDPYSGEGHKFADETEKPGGKGGQGGSKELPKRDDIGASDTSTVGSEYFEDQGKGNKGEKSQSSEPTTNAPRPDLGSPDTSTIGDEFYKQGSEDKKKDKSKL